MPFSHHSHSGQFCPGHAKDSLEEVIQTAISQKMRVFCLTEHMPRSEQDLYPEEIAARVTFQSMVANERAYFSEAVRLRDKYASQIHILIGFESDWIRTGQEAPSSLELITNSLTSHPFDFFVGSIHHTHTIPIDYDHEMYAQARERASPPTDEKLFEDYFDEQFTMLEQLKPLVVGHFDLIRLKSADPERSFQQWPGVWSRILRNLHLVAAYGGLLEVNSAALRKGMSEPYPKREICEEFLTMNGRFCLSDDSHGVDQVGLNYHRVLDFLDQAGITTLHYLERTSPEAHESVTPVDPRFPHTQIRSQSVADVKKLQFWSSTP